jgi:hypothetical protein
MVEGRATRDYLGVNFAWHAGPGRFFHAPHDAGAPNRVLPRRSCAGCLFGFDGALTRFWGRRWYTNLDPELKIHVNHVLGGVLEPSVEMLLGQFHVGFSVRIHESVSAVGTSILCRQA